jgi:hypothetical protein
MRQLCAESPLSPDEEFRNSSDLRCAQRGNVHLQLAREAFMHLRLLLALTLCIAVSSPLAAHDFWLAATPWIPGASLTVTGNVGHFPDSTEYPDPAEIRRWQVVGPRGELDPALGFRQDGKTLVADLALPSPGAYLATMAVLPRTIQMKGPAFTSYLHEERLDWVVAAREKAGVSEQTARALVSPRPGMSSESAPYGGAATRIRAPACAAAASPAAASSH